MSNSGFLYLAIAIISLATSFILHHNDIVDGIGKALFGVFFILFLIVRLFGEKNA